MALVSQVYFPEIWALESLMVLRDNLIMARLVHRDFENEVATRGNKVNTRKPRKLPVHTWAGQSGTDADLQMAVDNLGADDITITLDTLIYTAFLVEDKDASLSVKELRDEFLIPAMDPLAQKIDDDVMSEFVSPASNDVDGNAVPVIADGTVGLGAAMDEDDVLEAQRALDVAQCPVEGRRLVLSPSHQKNLLSNPLFVQVDQSGSAEALENSRLRRKFNFDIFMSQNVPDAVDTDTTPQSLAFHRNALALVTRPLRVPEDGLGVRAGYNVLDGISLRVLTGYDRRYFGVTTQFDILYGVQLLDAHLARIINP